jgi:hypothetical protein
VIRNEIDLEHHILFIAFKNKYIDPRSPISTQELISNLMINYPYVFQSSLKISYAISTLKTEGLVYEKQELDVEAYNKCVEDMKQKHKRMGEDRIRKECLRKLGYRSIILPTEAGVIEFCSRVSKYITDRTTKTNIIILDVCKTYQT